MNVPDCALAFFLPNSCNRSRWSISSNVQSSSESDDSDEEDDEDDDSCFDRADDSGILLDDLVEGGLDDGGIEENGT